MTKDKDRMTRAMDPRGYADTEGREPPPRQPMNEAEAVLALLQGFKAAQQAKGEVMAVRLEQRSGTLRVDVRLRQPGSIEFITLDTTVSGSDDEDTQP